MMKQPKVTDLQMWTLANAHLIVWKQLNIPGKTYIWSPWVGKRNVSSMVITMKRRRWIKRSYTPLSVELTQEGARILTLSRLNPDRLVWC